jgi:carboxypeptidase D
MNAMMRGKPFLFILLLSLYSLSIVLATEPLVKVCLLKPEELGKDLIQVQSKVLAAIDRLELLGFALEEIPRTPSNGSDCAWWGEFLALTPGAEEYLPKHGYIFEYLENPVKEAYNSFLRRLEEEKQEGSLRKRDPQNELDEANLFRDYHDNARLQEFMQQLHDAYPTLTNLFSIGQSKRGVDLWVMEISKNAGTNEIEPEVKYISNMHGDEVVGRQLALYFMHYLCTQYGKPGMERVTALVNSTRIFILPTMNPDGFAAGRRGNANSRDLNRNFPDQYSCSVAVRTQEPEVKAVMDWSSGRSFSLSANFHGGSLVANYPFDGNQQCMSGRYSASPDDALFKHLALIYASNNPSMTLSTEFTNGITNGAQWYVLYGGMQDWNYLWLGDLELTLEVSNIKWPSPSTLRSFWNENRESMMAYLEQVHRGIWGVVTDAATGLPLAAKITVDRFMWVKTDPENGDYHRPLLPNLATSRTSYRVMCEADGYVKQVKEVNLHEGNKLRVDFRLERDSSYQG